MCNPKPWNEKVVQDIERDIILIHFQLILHLNSLLFQ